LLNKYIKCNFRGYRCGTTTIVDIRGQRVNISLSSSWNEKNVQTKFVQKVNTLILWPETFPPKIVSFVTYANKYGRDRPSTDDNIVLPMYFAWWITNATHTYSEYITKNVTLARIQCSRSRNCLSSEVLVMLVCAPTCYRTRVYDIFTTLWTA